MAAIDQSCLSCGLYKSAKCANMDPSGSDEVEIYVVGESPSGNDDAAGKPFSGPSGRLVKDQLRQAGIDMRRVRFYNAINCHAGNRLEVDAAIDACGHRVRNDINKTRPKSILLLGTDAVKAVFPGSYATVYTMQRTRGVTVPFVLNDGTIVPAVCTLGQGLMMGSRDQSMKQVWFDDIAKATDYRKYKLEVSLKAEVIHCKTMDLVKECFKKLATAPIAAFDFETTALKPYPHPEGDGELYSVAFAFDDGTCYAIPLYNYWPKNITLTILQTIGKWFIESNPDQIKIGHNTKFDLIWGLFKAAMLYANREGQPEQTIEDLVPVGKYEDTALLSWILDERSGMSRLKVSAWRYFGVKDWSMDVTDVRKHPLDNVLTYNALDSFYTLRLFQHLRPKVASSESYDYLYTNLLLPVSMQFVKVEMRGVPIDMTELRRQQTYFDEKLLTCIQQIRKESGKYDLNPGSTKQLQNYFINECKYQMVKKTATGFSMDDDALEHIVKEYNDNVAKLIMEWRGYQKLQSTYVAGMVKNIFRDGCLHGSFNLVATVTGRTSSSDPNMQNFPKRANKEIRGIVRAPEGYKLVSFDYGQIEARLFGVVTADPEFCDVLSRNYDIHLENSRFLFGDEKAKEYRGPVKNGTFAMLYGAGDQKIADTTGAPVEAVTRLRALVFGRFKQFLPWQESVLEFEKQYGYVESLFGRRRRSPMISTEILNHTTQSTASDMTLSAMNVLGRRYKVAFMIHDDLSFFLPDNSEMEATIEKIAATMLTVPWLYLSRSPWKKAWVPLQVEASIGDNWCSQKEILKVDSLQMCYNNELECITAGQKFVEEFSRSGW